jgi:hypothetical protein
MQRKLLGIIIMGFGIGQLLLIIHSAFIKYWRKKGNIVRWCIKKAYDSVRREVLYNILIEFGIPLKLVRLIKMCLNETYSRVWVGKHLSDRLSIKNGFKQGDALLPPLFNFAVEFFFTPSIPVCV